MPRWRVAAMPAGSVLQRARVAKLTGAVLRRRAALRENNRSGPARSPLPRQLARASLPTIGLLIRAASRGPPTAGYTAQLSTATAKTGPNGRGSGGGGVARELGVVAAMCGAVGLGLAAIAVTSGPATPEEDASVAFDAASDPRVGVFAAALLALHACWCASTTVQPCQMSQVLVRARTELERKIIYPLL